MVHSVCCVVQGFPHPNPIVVGGAPPPPHWRAHTHTHHHRDDFTLDGSGILQPSQKGEKEEGRERER
jgi:hypothetical protein